MAAAAPSGGGPPRGKSLLLVYLALVITGDFVAYGIGLVIERNAPAASLRKRMGSDNSDMVSPCWAGDVDEA